MLSSSLERSGAGLDWSFFLESELTSGVGSPVFYFSSTRSRPILHGRRAGVVNILFYYLKKTIHIG